MRRFLQSSMLAVALVLTAALSQAMAQPAPWALTPFHHQKVQSRLKGMSQADNTRFQNLMNKATNIAEKRYVTQALANGHSIQAVENFANTIRGQSDTWLRDNLHLQNNSRRAGLLQHWQDSCGPATVLVIMGETDPTFALRYNRMNQAAQSDLQKKMLERTYPSGGKGGVAVPRGGKGGAGRWIEDILNAERRSSGLTFNLRHLNGTYNMNKALSELDAALAWGVPVPIVAKAPAGSSHYCIATKTYNNNGQKTYVIHDPWTGQTVVRTEAQFRENRLDLSGNHTLIALSIPTW